MDGFCLNKFGFHHGSSQLKTQALMEALQKGPVAVSVDASQWWLYHGGANHSWVVATQIFFIFTPNPGEMIQFDEHIFQMGWFNHQLDRIFVETTAVVF